jgi:hypothetical protein
MERDEEGGREVEFLQGGPKDLQEVRFFFSAFLFSMICGFFLLLVWIGVRSRPHHLIDARFIGHALISALRWRPLFV